MSDRENRGRRWLNAKQSTEYLALPTTQAFYRAVRRGQIPAYRWGKRIRCDQDDLDQVIKQGRLLIPLL